MTSERALEILSAYGADAARWPADEVGACLAQIARDPVLAHARCDAAVLDAALTGWARAPLVTAPGTDRALVSALAAIGPAAARRAPWSARALRPFAGATLAASVAAGLFITGHLSPVHPQAPARPMLAAQQPITDSEAFRQVFTPTPDEEEVL
jgi:hypothetical protein